MLDVLEVGGRTARAKSDGPAAAGRGKPLIRYTPDKMSAPGAAAPPLNANRRRKHHSTLAMCVAPARFRLLAHANMPVATLALALQPALARQYQLIAERQARAVVATHRVRRVVGASTCRHSHSDKRSNGNDPPHESSVTGSWCARKFARESFPLPISVCLMRNFSSICRIRLHSLAMRITVKFNTSLIPDR